jgi:hypothetical protein
LLLRSQRLGFRGLRFGGGFFRRSARGLRLAFLAVRFRCISQGFGLDFSAAARSASARSR